MPYSFDPELAPFADLIPLGSIEDVPAARAALAELLAGISQDLDTTGLRIEDRTIPGPPGDPDVVVRVFEPEGAPSPRPAILHIHGGGFVVGSVDAEQGGPVAYARGVGATVVSVEYRLAPEHPWPAGLEDCYAALVWLHAEADALGVDTERIAVMGGSAGGGLAASLALLAKERGGPALCHQFLLIPELDDRLETPSMRQFVDTPMWHRGNAVLSWQMYLGELSGRDDVPITAAPARATAEQLAGLPPAYVTVMQFDPLRDEGIAYAMRLLEAGVNTELHAYPGTWHGSAMIQGAAVSQREGADTLAALRRALAPT